MEVAPDLSAGGNASNDENKQEKSEELSAVVNGGGGAGSITTENAVDSTPDNRSDKEWMHTQPPKSVLSAPPAFRGGRGGGGTISMHFNRGGSVAGRGAGGNFSGRPFDPNWANNNGPGGPGGAPPQLELWVETKTEDGKSYYYHILSRETTWTKPEGPNVKVMSQSEIEEMNKKQQQQQQPNSSHPSSQPNGIEDKDKTEGGVGVAADKPPANVLTSQPPPGLLSQPPPTQQQSQITGPPQHQPQPQTMSQPPPNVPTPGHPQVSQPPPGMHQQPPPFFPPGVHPPPNFGQHPAHPPFGMPPPGYAAPGFPGAAPGGPGGPWGMPWAQQHMHQVAPQDKPAKNLIIKPGVIDPAVIARAAEWSEHRAPDGRPYYYHAARGESVWEKPQALRDMEAARMAAHGAAPQAAPPPVHNPALMPGMGMPPHLLNPLMHLQPGNPAAAFVDHSAAFAAAAAAKTAESNKISQTIALEKEAKKYAEEKRKKAEEEQKKANSAAKPVDKSRPISSTPIPGTPWCVVWTGDARVFFYNPSTRTSVWERPEELLEREEVDKAINNPPEQLKSLVNAKAEAKEESEEDKTPTPTAASATANSTIKAQTIETTPQEEEDDGIIKIKTESDSSDVEEVPTKKLRINKSKKADASEAAAEAEVRAAKERALVPLETRVKQFKEMLREKDVSAFSTWEKELHKIVFDPRYLLLTSKERKQVFEKYVKDRAEEERKEKRNKMRQKREEFRNLLEDCKLHGKSSFSDFCQRYGKDERYKAIEKVRERESLFNEYLLDVRRREKEEKQMKKEQIHKEFIDMLRERADSIDRHCRWHDIKKKFEMDPRYRAVENSMYREDYFHDFLRIMKEEKRRREKEREKEREQRERERERERERKSERKSDRKDKDRKDRSRSRTKDRTERDGKDSSSKEKERKDKLDKDKHEKKKHKDYEEGEHHSEEEHSAASDHNEEEQEVERLQKERERQLRAEQSIREREKEVQRTLAGHLRDRDKERELHKREEAVGHFNALLTDLVRNPDFTWKEVKRQLRKDHRWELVEFLDRDDRERIFNEHIDSLMKKKREKFREMLDEITTLELTSIWKDIKKLVKDDPRYLKYNNSEKCEREFRDYIVDKQLAAKIALKELLKECKLITHKSHELVKENPNHLKEILDILKMDKRYLILEHIADERTTIVVNYLDELHKRGPPPPPTASDASRRVK
ncbi:transcription elongation regulator 1 [Stomoxys calcitrans]|uniref:Transcription elongation regulator 1 n=1 Tax=Stomoxys calcitrans TaxID=35570 RepID=A0A1I8PUG3_STOCA|nr:transcription elongation regulator 1 [Stomoxys calcitrans]